MHIIGHRGAMGLAQENSLHAITLALSHNVDAVELDVRLHHGSLVLSHDPTLPSQAHATVADALALVNGSVPIVFDIKDADAVVPLLALCTSYSGDVCYSSFDYAPLAAVRALNPNASLAVIESWSGVRAVARASLLDTKRIHINQQWLWAGFVRSMKHRGYTLYSYTVNSNERADELKKWGIDGIFTDYPDRILTR